MTPIIKRLELAEAALAKNGFVLVDGVWVAQPDSGRDAALVGIINGLKIWASSTYTSAPPQYLIDRAEVLAALAAHPAPSSDAALVDPRPLYEAWEVQEAERRKGEPLDKAERAYVLKRWPEQSDTYNYCPHHWPAFKAGFAAHPANGAQAGLSDTDRLNFLEGFLVEFEPGGGTRFLEMHVLLNTQEENLREAIDEAILSATKKGAWS